MPLKKKGDIGKDVSKAKQTLEARFNELSKNLAEQYYRLLISNIQSNKFGFSLAESTLMRRAFLGLGTTPLIERGEYLKGIIIEGFTVTVTQGIHTGSGLSFVELSDILEKGRMDKSIPPFPVWRLTFEEFKPLADEQVNDLIKDIL